MCFCDRDHGRTGADKGKGVPGAPETKGPEGTDNEKVILQNKQSATGVLLSGAGTGG